jgi:hypothetical protein
MRAVSSRFLVTWLIYQAPELCELFWRLNALRHTFFMVKLRVVTCLLVLTDLICGCGRSDITEAAQSSAPHMTRFVEFDQWTRRVCAADQEFLDRGPEAFREALFAPLRRDDRVLDAWVELSGPKYPPRLFNLRPQIEQPKKTNWTPVRHRQLGELSVSSLIPCSIAADHNAAPRACVLISRQTRSSNRDLRLTVAFRND